MREMFSSEIPRPVSSTDSVSVPESRQPTRTVTAPSSVYLYAFDRRLKAICLRRCGSMSRSGISPISVLSLSRFPARTTSHAATTSRTSFGTSVGSFRISSFPRSIFDRSSMSSTRRASTFPLESIEAT